MKIKICLSAVFAFFLTFASLSAMADADAKSIALLGDAAPAAAATRVVKIDADTKYVNVKTYDVVKFVANGKDITWNFDNPNMWQMKLTKIMPTGALDHEVMVYVNRNPLYDAD